MKAKLCAALSVSLLICLLFGPSMAEEERSASIAFDFPENICMAAEADMAVPDITADQQVDLYTVALYDFQEYFVPSLFPEGMILNAEEHAEAGYMGTVDEISRGFMFNDGSYLYFPSALGMVWEGDNASKYRQLLRYLYDHDISLDQRQLDFMSPAEAVSLCGDILEKMNLHHLTAAAVYGLSSDDLARYTDQMSADYSDMKLERFSQVTGHDAVYCIEFRTVFDTIPTVSNAPFLSGDGAQGLFVIREDGPVYIEMHKVTERFDSITAQPIALALEDALRLFCAGKDVSKSDADDYEITHISFGYFESVASGSTNVNRQTTYVPYYQIDYLYKLHFGDQETQIPCEILINALDGTMIKTRGV